MKARADGYKQVAQEAGADDDWIELPPLTAEAPKAASSSYVVVSREVLRVGKGKETEVAPLPGAAASAYAGVSDELSRMERGEGAEKEAGPVAGASGAAKETPCERLRDACVTSALGCAAAVSRAAGALFSRARKVDEAELARMDRMEVYKTSKAARNYEKEVIDSRHIRGPRFRVDYDLKHAVDSLDMAAASVAIRRGANLNVVMKIPRHSNENAGMRVVPAMRCSVHSYLNFLLNQAAVQLSGHERTAGFSGGHGGFKHLYLEERYEALYRMSHFFEDVHSYGVESALELHEKDIKASKSGVRGL